MKQSIGQRTALTTTLTMSPQMLRLVSKLEKTDAEMRDDALMELETNPALEQAVDTLAAEQNKTEDGEQFNETADQVLDGDYGSEDDMPSYRLRVINRGPDDNDYRSPVVAETTLSDFLLTQLRENESLTPTQQIIAEYVVDNLEDNGYLTRSAASIADDVTFKANVVVDTAQVEEVIDMVRELDPAGIAAHDLRDCLLLQIGRLKGNNEANRIAYDIVDRYFDTYPRGGNEAKIAASLGVDIHVVDEAIKVVRRLNPKPASAFTGERNEDRGQQIMPDFEVTVEDGRITGIALLNSVPELAVSQSYEQGLKSPSRGDYAFIRENYNKAVNYLDMLKMRQEKLYATILAIVKRQQEYFITGDETCLVPMRLKDIEAETGMDESVLSRATRNKYVDTPWGIKPLRFFFRKAVKHDSGQSTTALKVRDILKSIIDAEDKNAPLTDGQLCDRLNSEGFAVKRRTVSKYREELGFPPARNRKNK